MGSLIGGGSGHSQRLMAIAAAQQQQDALNALADQQRQATADMVASQDKQTAALAGVQTDASAKQLAAEQQASADSTAAAQAAAAQQAQQLAAQEAAAKQAALDTVSGQNVMLAKTAETQAPADMEAAMTRRANLGRAILSFRQAAPSYVGTLGAQKPAIGLGA